MKKGLCILLALMLAAALTVSASAVEVAESKELLICDVMMGETTFMAQDEESREWALYDDTLEPVSDARFASCEYKSNYGGADDYYVVSEGEMEYDLYRKGVIDGESRLIIPCRYNALDNLGNGWFGGIVFKTATVDNYDMRVTSWTTDEVSYYLYDHVDLWKEDKMVATLERTQYNSYARHYGKYLVIEGADNVSRSYSPDGTVRDMGSAYGEYDYDYSRKTVTHNPTGTLAFTADCTLTEDQVGGTRYEVDGKFLDLQGNVVFTPEPGSYVSAFSGALTRIQAADKKVGIIDTMGNYIFPCIFDECYAIDDLLKYGYGSADIGGKYVALRADGTVTVETTYPYDSVNAYSGYWAKIKDMEGNVHVISNEIGEFATSKEDFYPANGYALIKDDDGQGVVYHYDGTVIANEGNLTAVESTANNRIAIVREGYQYYYGYVIEESQPAAAKSPAEIIASAMPDPDSVLQPPVIDTEALWTCSGCGSMNDGKFCPECGAPRPTEPVCASCGYRAENGKAFKFCPECGTPAQGTI